MILQQFSYHSPVQAHFGAGVSRRVVEFLKGYEKVAVVSGRTVLDRTGFRQVLDKTLTGKELHFFCEVESNPSIATVLRGAEFVRSRGCEVIIAVGGGSSLDAAKAIAVFAANESDFFELIGQESFPHCPLPVIAVPTTCGTGSEMNHYAIITDPEQHDKLNLYSGAMFPRFALLDPEMLRTLPAPLVVATAFDALTHGLEGYVSLRANPFSDTLALAAMERIIATLSSGADLYSGSALADLLFASSLAGVVILHTGTTLLHSLGYYLTNHKLIHHGAANAILLPYYLKMLALGKVDRYWPVAKLFKKHNFSVQDHLERLGGEIRLSALLSAEEIVMMIDYALTKRNVKSTPFGVNKEFLAEILSGLI